MSKNMEQWIRSPHQSHVFVRPLHSAFSIGPTHNETSQIHESAVVVDYWSVQGENWMWLNQQMRPNLPKPSGMT